MNGLFCKYKIEKTDGTPIDPNADYFVLRLDTDPIARRAATEYSYFVASQNGDYKLAKDLQARIARYDPKLEDAICLRYTGLRKNAVVEKLEAQDARIKELLSLNKDLLDNCNSLRTRCWKAEGIAINKLSAPNLQAGFGVYFDDLSGEDRSQSDINGLIAGFEKLAYDQGFEIKHMGNWNSFTTFFGKALIDRVMESEIARLGQ